MKIFRKLLPVFITLTFACSVILSGSNASAAAVLRVYANPVLCPRRLTVILDPVTHLQKRIPCSVEPAWVASYKNKLVVGVAMRSKYIALTFDDGVSQTTRSLVDILVKNNVKATFFLIGGYAKSYPDKVHYIADNGMEIGSHTMNHKLMNTLSYANALAEVKNADNAIMSVTGAKPLWIRYHGGDTNTTNRAIAYSEGHLYVNWQVSSDDQVQGTTVARVTANVLTRAKAGGIVSLHERDNVTVAALPGIIAGLKKQGYTIVTLSEMASHGSPIVGK